MIAECQIGGGTWPIHHWRAKPIHAADMVSLSDFQYTSPSVSWPSTSSRPWCHGLRDPYVWSFGTLAAWAFSRLGYALLGGLSTKSFRLQVIVFCHFARTNSQLLSLHFPLYFCSLIFPLTRSYIIYNLWISGNNLTFLDNKKYLSIAYWWTETPLLEGLGLRHAIGPTICNIRTTKSYPLPC